MPATREKANKLHEMLAETYRQKQPVPLEASWQAEVLHRTRLMNRSQQRPSRADRWSHPIFRQWIPAAGLGLAIAFLVAVVMMKDIDKEPDLASMKDPVEVVVAQLFWP